MMTPDREQEIRSRAGYPDVVYELFQLIDTLRAEAVKERSSLLVENFKLKCELAKVIEMRARLAAIGAEMGDSGNALVNRLLEEHDKLETENQGLRQTLRDQNKEQDEFRVLVKELYELVRFTGWTNTAAGAWEMSEKCYDFITEGELTERCKKLGIIF